MRRRLARLLRHLANRIDVAEPFAATRVHINVPDLDPDATAKAIEWAARRQ
jgi:hypothetical protein